MEAWPLWEDQRVEWDGWECIHDYRFDRLTRTNHMTGTGLICREIVN